MIWLTRAFAVVGACYVAAHAYRLTLKAFYARLGLEQCETWWCWRAGRWTVLGCWMPSDKAIADAEAIEVDEDDIDEDEGDTDDREADEEPGEGDEAGLWWPTDGADIDMEAQLRSGCYCKRCGEVAVREQAVKSGVELTPGVRHELSLVPYEKKKPSGGMYWGKR